MSYHVGFTGTRAGMTSDQWHMLRKRLAAIKAEHGDVVFHYGQAVGADEEAALLAHEMGFWVVSHPSNLPNQTSVHTDLISEARAPKAPLVRNHDIVDESSLMFATPRTLNEELRSGTWATIRYANRTGVTVEQILPVGDRPQLYGPIPSVDIIGEAADKLDLLLEGGEHA